MFIEAGIQSGITWIDLFGLASGECDHPKEATV